ncbi:reverse transcriptase domain-containing protein [Tanacetum coccineum]
MGIRHAKSYTLRGGPSMKLEQRLFKAWQPNNHSKNSSISSKHDLAHICTISGAIRGREITPPSSFSAIPITTTVFVATTPGNTPMAYRVSTSANQYFSEDYDEEQEMEPRPEPTRAATPPLRVASPRICRRGERTVGFEGAQSRGESRVERSTEGGRPSEEAPRGNRGQSVNLPPLLAAHLGRGENGQPFQSSLTSAYKGQALPNNIGGNLPSNDNFLHPFEGAIRMQKWLMPIACHMFTYTLKESAIIWWNNQKASSILDYENLKAKLRSHFSQQKKFMKTHLAVHNIKQREGESTRAFITRYTDDLQILGLHKEQRISVFVHGLRTQSLVKHLSTDLPSTYKGLMENTYTWVEVREVATNGVSNNRRDDFKRSKKFSWGNSIGQKDRGRFSPYKGQNHKLLSNLVKSPREILATEKVAKTFEQPPRLPGANWSKGKTRYCHFHEDYGHETNQCQELKHQIEEAVKSGQLAHLENSHSLWEKYPWRLRLGRAPSRTAMQQMGIVVSIVHGAIKFHTPRGIGTIFSEYNSQKPKEEEDSPTNKYQGNEENVLSCIDIEERMVINEKYPEQKITIGRQLPTRIKIRLRDLLKRYIDVFAWTSTHITGVPRVLMIGGETFNIEHRINVFNHVEPVKKKKRSLAPERNKAIHSQVEELTEAGILREVKYQTWVSNLMAVKKTTGNGSYIVEEGIYSGYLITNQGIRADPSKVPLKERGKDTPFHENSEKLYEWKDGSMDEGGRRSLSENERMLRVIANDGHTGKGRNSNNVSHNLRRKREHNIDGRKGKETNPRILRNSEGRIAKWAIEWGEHEIEFRGRNSIKGKILADFLAETPLTKNREAKNEEVKRKDLEPKNAWKLFTDGASSFDGSGAGLMVVSLVEVTNREIIKGMERTLGKAHQAWIDELPQSLWAHQTTPKSSNIEIPFSLVYGSEVVIPIEVTSIKEAHYKQKLEGYYNKNVKPSTFKPVTYVLRLNSASKAEYQGKMGSTWEGPYMIRKAYRDGANKLETLSGEAVD